MNIIWKWSVVAALVLLMSVVQAGTNRNVYSKQEVDDKLGQSMASIDKRLDDLGDDVDRLIEYLLEADNGGDVRK